MLGVELRILPYRTNHFGMHRFADCSLVVLVGWKIMWGAQLGRISWRVTCTPAAYTRNAAQVADNDIKYVAGSGGCI